jgi:hypothetical protein
VPHPKKTQFGRVVPFCVLSPIEVRMAQWCVCERRSTNAVSLLVVVVGVQSAATAGYTRSNEFVATWSENCLFLLNLDPEGASSNVLQWFGFPGKLLDIAVSQWRCSQRCACILNLRPCLRLCPRPCLRLRRCSSARLESLKHATQLPLRCMPTAQAAVSFGSVKFGAMSR